MLIDLLIQMLIIGHRMLIQDVNRFVDTNVHHRMLIQNVNRFVDTNVHHRMLIQNVN